MEIAERLECGGGQAAAALLDLDAGVGTGSGLNHDGLPLQVVTSSDRDGVRVRLIADPATGCQEIGHRYRRARVVLDRLLTTCSAGAARPLVDAALATSGPTSPEELVRFTRGVVWLACDARFSTWGCYIDSPWEAEVAWRKLGDFGATVLPTVAVFDDLVRSLRQHVTVGSVALEGDNRRTRAKVYFRFRSPFTFLNVDLPLIGDGEILRFLGLVLRDRTFGPDALIPCWGFDTTTGTITDFKIDVCAHCLGHSPDTWDEVLRTVQESFALRALPLEFLRAHEARLSFVGFGRDVTGRHRLNVYWSTHATTG